ncbi:MAG: acylphosphatase [Candidatus Marinimicrobia bacterium CG08_land_8_20_14_0_20_45_22]|nr:MAG: acylphosphatase [Candidatus Marinimicrobia bacterium CG08_land_8_20_14_0_20_45_22]
MKINVKMTVQGVVQGVGFRYFAMRKAAMFQVFGFVQNLDNGDVYIEAEGEEGLVNDFVREIQIGPMFGTVTDVIKNRSEKLVGYHRFEVRF